MIAIFSDTHSVSGHELEGEALTAARTADVVLHAGDFTSEVALEAFQRECDRLYAAHGNADDPAVCDRLPPARVVEADGVRFALTHRRDGGETGLAMFGRSRAADVVVFGHSHRPTVVDAGDVTLVNPGSHADPRGNRPGFAVLEPARGEDRETSETATDRRLEGAIREPDGTIIETVEIRMP
ncbi:metallophosphoesterase [Natrinema caseinilyticum]|uniref:metallophosphoesterase n=1 Tax=Natrinema caseinilyticum TaxID=2961570 RepID=UPI0020C43592|nr:metallophosphoesterase [Natrinema caseinilyticum]